MNDPDRWLKASEAPVSQPPHGQNASDHSSLSPERAAALVDLLCRFDRLKSVERADLTGTGRHENVAEHTWHALAMLMAYRYVTRDHTIDYLAVFEMLIVHDLPEAVAGDTFIYDAAGREGKTSREREGLAELIGGTNPEFAAVISQRWEQFEAQNTAEACLAQAIDRLQAILQNLISGGWGWREFNVTREQILCSIAKTKNHSPFFASLISETVKVAEQRGFIPGFRRSTPASPLVDQFEG